MAAYMQRSVIYVNGKVPTKSVARVLEQTKVLDNSDRFVLFISFFQNTFNFIFRKESRVLEIWPVRH